MGDSLKIVRFFFYWLAIYSNKYRPIPAVGQLSQYSDSPQAGQSADRVPVAAQFCVPVQTGPGAYPAYTMSTASFPGSKAGAWR